MTYMDVCLIFFIASCLCMFVWRWIDSWNYSLQEKTIVFLEKFMRYLGFSLMIVAVLLGIFGGYIYG